jgi:hypothetical protein
MKPKCFYVVIASCMFAISLYGCGTRRAADLRTGGGHENHSNTSCNWSFDRAADGRVIAGTLDVKNNQGHSGCSSYHSNNPDNQLYIGESPAKAKRILSIPPATEFSTEGSCRYCYINSSGGMSCVTYQSGC